MSGDDFLAILKTLAQVLSADDVATAALQAVAPDGATVSPAPGEDTPGNVRISVPSDRHLTLDDLEERFGKPRELPRLHRKAPVEYLFTLDDGDSAYTVALLAEVRNEVVEAVTLRRDIRLS